METIATILVKSKCDSICNGPRILALHFLHFIQTIFRLTQVLNVKVFFFLVVMDLHNLIKSKNLRTLRDINNGGQRTYSAVQLGNDDLQLQLLLLLHKDKRQYLKLQGRFIPFWLEQSNAYFSERREYGRSVEGICCI